MRLTGGLLVLALTVVSCDPKGPPPPIMAEVAESLKTTPPIGVDVQLSDLNPDASPGPKAILKLGSTKLPVKVNLTKNEGTVTVNLVATDVVIESEVYDSRSDSFSLKAYGLEKFAEPLPLLKKTMKIGDHWNWSGMVEGGKAHKAEAEVTTRTDKLVVDDTEYHAVISEVKLRMDSGGPTPSERRLVFWFVPGKGLLKREMGSASIREVAAEE